MARDQAIFYIRIATPSRIPPPFSFYFDRIESMHPSGVYMGLNGYRVCHFRNWYESLIPIVDKT